MTMKKWILSVSVFFVAAGIVHAAHIWDDPSAWWSGHLSYDQNTPKFTDQEFSLDLFGSYINPEGEFHEVFEHNIRHGYWGGGVGANYFITRELGVGADFNMSDKEGARLVDDVVGSVMLRFPIESIGLAPYLIGSGGRAISPIYQWTYGGGVGLDLRFNPTTGIFSDARYFFGDQGTIYNRLLIRMGLRLIF